jgi:hypothetical protein
MNEQIKQQLAVTLGQAADTLTLVSKERVEWSDSALGCPQRGMMYMQVITPGYKLTFNDGTRTYDIHTGRQGSPAIWCDHGRSKRLG